jgi:hypothetical protein
MRYVRYALLGCALCLLLGGSSAFAFSHGAKKAGAGGGGYAADYYSGARDGPGPRAAIGERINR